MDFLPYFFGVVSGGLVGYSLAWHQDFRLRVAVAGLGLLGMIACAWWAMDL
jgi:hypothetical protein